MDALELEKIQRTMEEEHRLDREAFERLKRFMHPSRNGHSRSVPQEPTLATANRENPSGTEATYRAKILAVLLSDPTRTWDGPKMVEYLATTGKKVGGKRPVAIVTRAFRSLVKDGLARRVKRGVGTIPTTYRAAEQPQQQQSA